MNDQLLLKTYFKLDFKSEIKRLNDEGFDFPTVLINTHSNQWHTIIAHYDSFNDQVLLEGYSFSLDCNEIKRYVVLKG